MEWLAVRSWRSNGKAMRSEHVGYGAAKVERSSAM